MMKAPIDAILALVRYLEADERKHFECKWETGEDTSKHIYNQIKTLSDWLDAQPEIPNAAERERQRLAPFKDAFAQAGIEIADGDFAEFWRSTKPMN
jgi:hypothetical protein